MARDSVERPLRYRVTAIKIPIPKTVGECRAEPDPAGTISNRLRNVMNFDARENYIFVRTLELVAMPDYVFVISERTQPSIYPPDLHDPHDPHS